LEVTPDFWIMPISRGLINKGIPARWRYQTNRILSLRCLPFHHSGVSTAILAFFPRSVKRSIHIPLLLVVALFEASGEASLGAL
jgi:hypothetical protein